MLDSRLNHVVAVARTGSFTAAADMVGMTQSGITKSVADLERQIGYSIFHRTSRGAVPTAEGREFVERTARLLEDAEELMRRPSGLEDPYAVVLRIGVCPASLEWCIAEPLELVLARHPSMRVDVNGASFERMVQQLRNGGVDVAVGLDVSFSFWSDLRRTRLATHETTLFVRQGHPLLSRKTVALSDIAAYDFVSPSASRPHSELFRDVYERLGADWRRRRHVVDYFPIVQRIVAKSDAIGVVPLAHSRTAQFQERFGTLDSIELFPPAPLCCAIRSAWEPQPAVRAFILACVECMPPAG